MHVLRRDFHIWRLRWTSRNGSGMRKSEDKSSSLEHGHRIRNLGVRTFTTHLEGQKVKVTDNFALHLTFAMASHYRGQV